MARLDQRKASIAVIIPCYNEQASIGSIVNDFRRYVPESTIYVFDNDSTDETVNEAKKAGAQIFQVRKKGKGNVVQAMFRDIEADYYVMTDGDGTYPAASTPNLLQVAIESKLDMVVGNRLPRYEQSDSRKGHFWGNRFLTAAVNYLFESDIQDLLSGYRVMSRRFVKSVPLYSEGFEVETALSIHAIDVGAKVQEVPIDYVSRQAGSASKLHTVRDGLKIVCEMLRLYKDQKPKIFYGLVSILFFIAGLMAGLPVIAEYTVTGLVPRFPSAILASGLFILGFSSGFAGVILSSISKSRRDIKKLAFLAIK